MNRRTFLTHAGAALGGCLCASGCSATSSPRTNTRSRLSTKVSANSMASARLPALRRYRDLRIYTTSGPDETQPDRIVATTQFVNEGSTRLEIDARLEPNLVLGFEGA